MTNPICERCRHAASFHGVDVAAKAKKAVKKAKTKTSGGRCRAFPKCGCPSFVEPTLTAAEVASLLGRSKTYVKDHARELGGRKTGGQWAFPISELEEVG